MARTRYRIFEGDNTPYFLTASTVNWLPLFSNPDIVQILLDSLSYLIHQERLTLYAYVIMENHVHLIASADNLSQDIADFKSFTARKGIDYYKSQNNPYILNQLSFHKLAHKVDREYQFWQEGSHPQQIMDHDMMEQKVAYIHHNPVRRGYVDEIEHWRYSSARNYGGAVGLVPVTVYS